MKLTKEEVIKLKKSHDHFFDTGHADFRVTATQGARECLEDWLEQHAEIEILKEQAEIDKDFINQYQAQVKSLKARLEAAEMVVEEASGFINAFEKSHRQDCRYYFEAPKIEDFLGRPQLYLTADERCDCGYSAYTKVSKEYEKLKAGIK